MDADFELDESGELQEAGFRRTMYRNNGGRPRGYSPKAAKAAQAKMEGQGEDDDSDPESQEGQISTAVKKAVAQARKETALAGLNELELKIKSGEYLPRSAYREATATLLATLAQGLRSLPDTLESRVGLDPRALELVDTAVTEALNNVAETLALFTGDGA